LGDLSPESTSISPFGALSALFHEIPELRRSGASFRAKFLPPALIAVLRPIRLIVPHLRLMWKRPAACLRTSRRPSESPVPLLLPTGPPGWQRRSLPSNVESWRLHAGT